jgi:hypothetical protein
VLTWLPSWNSGSPDRETDYVIEGVAGGPTDDRVMRIVKESSGGGWLGLLEALDGVPTPLDLTGYQTLHFDIWTPNVTSLVFKVRDYGSNGVYDGAGVGSAADSERQTADLVLTPESWTSVSIDLDQLFLSGDARQLGQILLVNILTNESFDNYYLYLSNMRFE